MNQILLLLLHVSQANCKVKKTIISTVKYALPVYTVVETTKIVLFRKFMYSFKVQVCYLKDLCVTFKVTSKSSSCCMFKKKKKIVLVHGSVQFPKFTNRIDFIKNVHTSLDLLNP